MKGHARPHGAALMVSLILLMVISLLATAGARIGMNGLRLALNAELRLDAFHRAQSLVDAVISIPANTVIAGAIGASNCLPGMVGCTHNTLALPEVAADGYAAVAASGAAVTVRRLGPDRTPPPRFSGYSAVRFASAQMQVESRYNDPVGGGRAEIVEGVAVMLPLPGG